MPKIAIYAGSFDPITHGHEDLAPGTDVVKVAAQLVVQFAHTHLGLGFVAM